MLQFKTSREAGGAARNFRLFINEWFEEKKAKIELNDKAAPGSSSRTDLMGIFVLILLFIWEVC